ncbi:MAG: hypothetical protein H6Q20_1832 [Bacteroidetes bacterium]|nr:hypothetical protein [Bacteroidota bacterium]
MKRLVYILLIAGGFIGSSFKQSPIDRKALVNRNNPHVTAFDSLAAFSVGNGEFAYTADITGLQTFPSRYTEAIPLGTQSQWGWHSFANPEHYIHAETLKSYNFRGKEELYSVQFDKPERSKNAAEWFRVNPHRLHLGIIGFDFAETDFYAISNIDQKLNLWKGEIESSFTYQGKPVNVTTLVHPRKDAVCAHIVSALRPAIRFRMPYPTGNHTDDACDWNSNDKHQTDILLQTANSAILKRTIDATIYYIRIAWKGKASLTASGKNNFLLKPETDDFSFTAEFTESEPQEVPVDFDSSRVKATEFWSTFWNTGAAVDFSQCTDKRAPELERRVVLSQYLLAIQCAGSVPPQETGLTYNSWYGKFHLEMIWWHQAQFALWNRPQMLEHTLEWYFKALPEAREIARRQGFAGARWMKMTDPSAMEAPSKVGSFLIWQQPHIIYMAELIYRANPSLEFLKKYAPLIDETARFMISFTNHDMMEGRYELKGIIPAQETLRADETVNPPFELSYWHFALNVAQKWRERLGQKRNLQWDEVIDNLSPLAYQDGLYLAAETAPDTYKDIRFTSDHMAVLGALGVLPQCQLVRKDYMQNTLNWVWDNWNWGRTWGWDFPMTAMNAARLGDREKAVGALLMEKRTNTYLPNGHNYRDTRLRVYLPGNGGLLTAVAMMCAGWDGCKEVNPGFPKDGKWKVRWEGLKPLP